ncbi:hypothetical protein J18TS1_39110 [Oceanobacillus oncorhynchi subsp. incaldanensis]|uniref:Uncharacterized protein n=1 Tax=Oceanobacillus oncorhynchi TaxID=545501 RepID=A0A0A1MYC6_9BACI|nr:hypothetical protein [Oceanobacillus oncorhynchi]MDM8101004.1 hypothetical protein [Oceanobacillus oncorhynchi]UUI38821.1 hypothetical protein NP440_15970 [Oceanobacillus oncorhynchi]GIO20811.1 hypothetical protein J18TS1_39110 [Oceanobacillus oncorhynchi subsp. incaldanensis]CEI84529.1 hypothetical protein BN997_04480 [Oceanobacillus oncorhynchi]
MGYILPVQTSQYADYHQRVQPTQKKADQVESAFKVQLDRKHQELSATYERYYRNRPEPQKPIDLPLDSSLITGRGRHINKYV